MLKHGLFESVETTILEACGRDAILFGDKEIGIVGQWHFIHAFSDLMLIVLPLEDSPCFWEVAEDADIVGEGLLGYLE